MQYRLHRLLHRLLDIIRSVVLAGHLDPELHKHLEQGPHGENDAADNAGQDCHRDTKNPQNNLNLHVHPRLE